MNRSSKHAWRQFHQLESRTALFCAILSEANHTREKTRSYDGEKTDEKRIARLRIERHVTHTKQYAHTNECWINDGKPEANRLDHENRKSQEEKSAKFDENTLIMPGSKQQAQGYRWKKDEANT